MTYIWPISAVPIRHCRVSLGLDRRSPYAQAVAPTDACGDRSPGAEAAGNDLTFSVSRIDADILNGDAAFLRPSAGKSRVGTGDIPCGTVAVSLIPTF